MKKRTDSELLTLVLLGLWFALVVVALGLSAIWRGAGVILAVVFAASVVVPWGLTLVVAGYTKPGVPLKRRSVLLGQLSSLGNWLGGVALFLAGALISSDVAKTSDFLQLKPYLLDVFVAATACGVLIASVGAWVGVRLAGVEGRNSVEEKLVAATKHWGYDRVVFAVAEAICTIWVTSWWALLSCLLGPYLIFVCGVAVADQVRQ